MDKKVIEAIQTAISEDESNQDDFVAYDDMDAVKYDFGDMLEDWMIPAISTEPMNALKILANIFDSHNPKVRITPFGEADKERADNIKWWMEYQFARINQRAGKSPLRALPHMAGKYGRVALQVDYLPYWLPKNPDSWSKEQKAQMRNGAFCVALHNPRNVYYSMGKWGLKWVASVTLMTPKEVVEQWSIYDEKTIKSAVKKIETMMEEDEEFYFIQVDFTSFEKRQVALFKTTNKSISDFSDYDEDTDHIVVLDAENKLGFLNWVVVESESTPLLAGVHKGNLFAYQTVFDTIKKSGVMRRALPPLMVSTTADGKGVEVDYTGADPQAKKTPGELLEPLVMPPMDSAVFSLAQEESARMENALGVSKLAGMDASNVQYSTVNALIDLNMNNLEPYKRTSEKALEQVGYLMLKWVEFSGDSSTAYRTSKTSPDQIAGEEIIIDGDVLGDVDNLLVKVSLITKSDQMQAINRISMMKQAGFRIPDAELLEEVGYDNAEIFASMWEEEQLQSAALQLLIKDLNGKKDLELQAASMQMQTEQQMQMQQMQAQQQMSMEQQAQMGQMANPDQGLPSNVNGQGFNGAMGGTPPMMAEPGMTAEQVGR